MSSIRFVHWDGKAMKKIQEHKKIVIIVFVILLTISIVLFVVLGGKEKDIGKVLDNQKQETQVDDEQGDDSNSQGGLVISEPEEADKESSDDKVEFVGPDGNASNTSDKENTENGANEEIDGDTDSNENTDDNDVEGNLEKGVDDTEQYGDFF